jgi:hypothetical protein
VKKQSRNTKERPTKGRADRKPAPEKSREQKIAAFEKLLREIRGSYRGNSLVKTLERERRLDDAAFI